MLSYHSISIFFDHAPKSKLISWINRCHCGYKFSLFEWFFFKGHSPILSIFIKTKSSLNHVQSNSNYVACSQLSTIIWTCWVTIVSCLAVINGPTFISVTKCTLKVCNSGATHTNFDELSFIDKNLKVISASFSKYLGS